MDPEPLVHVLPHQHLKVVVQGLHHGGGVAVFDGAADLDLVFTVNASTSPMTGLWLLRVRDAYADDTGYLDRWALLI